MSNQIWMAKFRLSLLVLLFTGTAQAEGVLQPVRRVGNSCQMFFFPAVAKRVMNQGQAQQLQTLNNTVAGDTTGLRRESKYVVDDSASANFTASLERSLGKLEARETAPEGKANLTFTTYAAPLNYVVKGPEGKSYRNVKLRVRQYLVEDVHEQSVARNAITDGYKFLEFKAMHPTLDQVVIKSRLRLSDRDIALLLNPETFAASKDAVLARAVADSKFNKADVAVEMLKLIGLLHAQQDPGQKWDTEYVSVSYRREAFRKVLQAVDGRKIDIQITIDQNVVLSEGKGESDMLESLPDARVIEIKIPVEFAGLTSEDIAMVPGLAVVKEAIEALSQQQRSGFVANHGKFSNLMRLLKE